MTNNQIKLKTIWNYKKKLNPPFDKQFYHDSYVYAANKYVAIKMPTEICNSSLSSKDKLNKIVTIWDNIPDPLPAGIDIKRDRVLNLTEKYVCHECDPSITKTTLEWCVECGGEGVVFFDNDYHDYSVECRSCLGNGEIKTSDSKYARSECPKCGGTGTCCDSYTLWKVEVIYLAPSLLRLIIEAVGDIVAYPLKETHSVYFTFCGGEGFVGQIKYDQYNQDDSLEIIES